MNEITAINLLRLGAGHKVRQALKKLSIEERMRALHQLLPYVKETQATLEFFQKHFAIEIGALLTANYDYVAAAKLYRVVSTKTRRTP